MVVLIAQCSVSMETILTLIVTICLDGSEYISVKAYFMNGALFVSKPHYYPNLSIEFYVMSTVNTNEKVLWKTSLLSLPVHV